MRIRSILISTFVLALVAACGGGSPTATGTPGPAATAASQAPLGTQTAPSVTPPAVASVPVASTPVSSTPAPVGGSGTSIVHVVVGSGPQAGTYDSTGVKSDCNISSGGSGATYLDAAKTDGVTGLSFSSGQGGASVTQFYFNVLFGPIDIHQPVLEIDLLDPTAPSGSGTATLVDSGATLKWSIDGKTKDGVAITATIECGPVDRQP